MINILIEFVKVAKNKKYVRTKTRETSLITDTPVDIYDKVALDIVGPIFTITFTF